MKKRCVALLLCLLTLLSCLPVSANAAKTPLKITVQPQNTAAFMGTNIRVSLTAQGDGLTYQWFTRDAGDRAFHKSSLKTSHYCCLMDPARAGRQVYCIVSDQYGNSVKSNTVTLRSKPTQIVKQPASVRVAYGKNARTTVTAEGYKLTYQWYFRDAGSSKYYKSGITTPTYSVTVDAARAGRYLYCVIRDPYGNKVETQTVRVLANGNFKASGYTLAVGKELALAGQLDFSVNDTLTWKSSDPSVASVSSSGVVKGLRNGSATITVTGSRTGIRATCKVQVGKLKQIALTFDDGPSSHTARLLDYLEDHDEAKVTFFMVGNRINSYKTSVRRMAEQGHELGYHSYAHKTQTNLTNAQINADYKKTDKILKDLTGKHFTLWRTPGGAYNSRVLQNVPLPHIMWSVDTRDWETRNSTRVYNSILNNAKDGAIILLHDLHGTTVDGAIRAMDKLLDQGYELVTVTELLSRDGTPPKKGVTYRVG